MPIEEMSKLEPHGNEPSQRARSRARPMHARQLAYHDHHASLSQPFPDICARLQKLLVFQEAVCPDPV
ncbi:hypothetical protein J1614_008798 [Plenodomus biglobosus]|nr:hypothetical protein J1614_008798 [Plenodomus biglobosus]